ncbi:MAG: ATP-binding protein, partial [Gammaproteobacteria bacterium]|nr:ATP-binding protein [Gammaproteobacteria bacterium]
MDKIKTRAAINFFISKSRFLILFFSMILINTASVYAGQTIDISKFQSDQPIGQLLYFHEDKGNNKKIEDILDFNRQDWSEIKTPIPNYGFVTATHWLRLDITNSSANMAKNFLTVSNPSLDLIEYYQVSNKKIVKNLVMGDRQNFNARPISTHDFVIPVELNAGETANIYFRIKNDGAMQYPVYLRQISDHVQAEQSQLFAWGIYFGIMLIMMLYNIVLYIAIKDIGYFFFSLSLLGSILFQLALSGFGFTYVWSNTPQVNAWMIPFSNSLFQVASCAFILNFLGIEKKNKIQYNVLISLIVILTLIGFASFVMPYSKMVVITTFFTLPFAIIAFIISGLALMRGIKFARFFLMSWAILGAFSLMLAMEKIGIVPRNFFTEYGMLFQNVIATLLLSLALADRINIEKKQRLLAEQEASEQKQKFLRLTVEKQERELQAQYDIIDANKKMLEALNETKMKSNFLATMSHEIRTPLHGIIGISEMMEEGKLSAKQQQQVTMIKNSGSALLGLINDVLDYSKIEAGKMEIEAHDFHLNNLCQETVDNFYSIAKNKSLVITLDIHIDTPTYITGDSNRLRQIMLNLISNAIKFTEAGSISVLVENIESEYEPDSGYLLKFEIVDTGIGIPKKIQNQLFEKFSQADTSTTRKYGGSGLGLSICKSLVKLMGGEIGVKSSKGQG